jgi:predicted DNA-binding transcriptional regulator YafY
MDVANTPDLRSWILSFGSGAEVLEPKDLRSTIAREFHEALKRYEAADS